MTTEREGRETARPWKLFHKNGTLSVYHAKVDDVIHWSGFDGAGPEGRVTPRDVANAKLIVEAVNSHSQSLATIEGLADACEGARVFLAMVLKSDKADVCYDPTGENTPVELSAEIDALESRLATIDRALALAGRGK